MPLTPIPPDLSETVAVAKKAVIPMQIVAPPKLGEIWPRGSKEAAG